MEFNLRKGTRYRAIVNLGFVERLAGNETVAEKFRAAGFSDVHVTGEGGTRYVEGIWNSDDQRADYPAQISDVSVVEA